MAVFLLLDVVLEVLVEKDIVDCKSTSLVLVLAAASTVVVEWPEEIVNAVELVFLVFLIFLVSLV